MTFGAFIPFCMMIMAIFFTGSYGLDLGIGIIGIISTLAVILNCASALSFAKDQSKPKKLPPSPDSSWPNMKGSPRLTKLRHEFAHDEIDTVSFLMQYDEIVAARKAEITDWEQIDPFTDTLEPDVPPGGCGCLVRCKPCAEKIASNSKRKPTTVQPMDELSG